MPLPARASKNYIEDLPVIWHESLTGLTNAPGSLRSRCTRNIENPQEVLFAIATEQNRHNVRDAQGLLVNRRFGTLGIPCQHAWIREPHTGDHGQLVEKGVMVQAWLNTEPPIIFEAVDQDENARDNLRKQVRRINPVNMEEITWNVVKVEDEDGDEYDYEGGGGERT
ncbi:hypothetical protein ACHAO8_001921 [Botrytis cinerea]